MTEAELICELSLLQRLPRGLLFTFLQPSIPFQNQSCRCRRRGGDSPLPPSPILGRSVNPISTRMLIMPNTLLEVSRSRNKIVEPKLLSKIKRMNLFFYPDDSEILETWNQNSSFNYFRQDRKTNLSICFLEEVTAQQFCFEIYWPLRAPRIFIPSYGPANEHESMNHRFDYIK